MAQIINNAECSSIFVRTDTVGVYFFEHGIPRVKHLVDIVNFFGVPTDLILNDAARQQQPV